MDENRPLLTDDEETIKNEFTTSEETEIDLPVIKEKEEQVEVKEEVVDTKQEEVKEQKETEVVTEKKNLVPLFVTLLLTSIVAYLLVRTCLGFYYGFKYKDYVPEDNSSEVQPE